MLSKRYWEIIIHVLIFGAHPDDIESFCGGTALRYVQMEARLYCCVTTNGEVGSATMTKVLKAEAFASAAVINAVVSGWAFLMNFSTWVKEFA